MNLESHIINALFPYPCTCCGNHFNEIFREICPDCVDYGQKKMKIKLIQKNEFSDGRNFFFKNLYYLSNYESWEKKIYQLAKFNNLEAARDFLLKIILDELKSFMVGETGYIIPAPSRRSIVPSLTREIAGHFNLKEFRVFKKSAFVENKNLNQYGRFAQIQRSVELNANIEQILSDSKKVLIFDDLWTTGATMNFMCRMLVDAGIAIERIECFVLFVRKKLES